MDTWMPETCREEINKYITQNCAPSWTYLPDYTGMRSQQNIKIDNLRKLCLMSMGLTYIGDVSVILL